MTQLTRRFIRAAGRPNPDSKICQICVVCNTQNNIKYSYGEPSTQFVGEPDGGQQYIFDLFWLFSGGRYKLGDWEAPEGARG